MYSGRHGYCTSQHALYLWGWMLETNQLCPLLHRSCRSFLMFVPCGEASVYTLNFPLFVNFVFNQPPTNHQPSPTNNQPSIHHQPSSILNSIALPRPHDGYRPSNRAPRLQDFTDLTSALPEDGLDAWTPEEAPRVAPKRGPHHCAMGLLLL